MGLFGGSSKVKTDRTTTPIAPSWAEGPVQDLFGKVSGLAGQDPTSFVAPANSSLLAANDRAMGLTGSPWNFDAAADVTRGVIGAGAPSASAGGWGDVGKFYNPYNEDVIARTTEDLNRQGDRQMQGVKLGYAGPNYGNNASVAEALSAGEITRSIGDTIGNLRKSGWDTAAGYTDKQADRDQQINMLNASLAAQGQDRALSGAGQLANLSALFDSNQRGNIGTLGATGGTLQDIQQATAGAPISVAGDIGSIMTGLSAPYFGEHEVGTQKTSSGGGLLSKIGQGLQIASSAASLFSDVRLKRDIERIDTRPDGLGVYAYRYVWDADDAPKHEGVMAHEVLEVRPEAVSRHSSGFLMVDYGAL